ncbi:MAG: glycosyltransferase family 4 protein [Candidatus Muiribacteriota bacterium]
MKTGFKKVCFFMPRAFQVLKGEKSGGAELNTFYIADIFNKLPGFEIDFLTGINGKSECKKINSVNFTGIKYLELKKSNIFYKVAARFYFLKEIFNKKSDIYFFSGASEFFGLGVIFLKILRPKSKIIYRGASDFDFNYRFLIKKPIIYFFTYIGLKFCDYIIVQNRLQKTLLKKFKNKKIKTVRCGVFDITKNTDMTDKHYFLYVGKYTEIKKPKIFLKIVKKFPDKKFVAIITGDGKIKEDFLSQSEKLKNLTVIDYVPWNDIGSYFQKAKALINTSIYEGFPNTFIQSFISKTPVLSLYVNPDNILDDYKTGYFAEGKFENLVLFIKNTDNNTYMEMGENSFNYVLKNHTVDKLISSYRKIFNKVSKLNV